MAGRGLFVLLLLIGLPFAWFGAAHKSELDFVTFYKAGGYLWEHGSRDPASGLCKYLPSADVAWMAIAWLPLSVAAVVWYCLGVWSWIGLLGTIRRYLLPGLDDATSRHVVLLAGLLAMPLALDGFCMGAFHIFMVWAMVAGLGRISRDRPWSGAFLLGTAIWIKLLPVVGVAYLLLKRRWQPALVALAWAAAIDIVLCVGAMGPQAAWNEHVRWWNQEGARSTSQQLTANGLIDEDRLTNQSTMVVMRRPADAVRRQAALRQTALMAGQSQRRATDGGVCDRGGAVGIGCRRLLPPPGARNVAGTMGQRDRHGGPLDALVFARRVELLPDGRGSGAGGRVGQGRAAPGLAWAVSCTWMAAIALLGLNFARAWGDLLWLSFALGATLVWSGEGNEGEEGLAIRD